ncbi:MAG: hypothetical protein AB7T31_12525 [Gemmatimonadales bacterium]
MKFASPERSLLAVGALVTSFAFAAASPCGAQSFQATLSRDTVPMGEVFELLVRVPVPPGSVVYFPDTVARTEVLESHSRVAWDAADAAGGGATLTLTYPVIAWGAGVVPVSGFDVFVSPLRGAPPTAAPALPGGSYVGPWGDAPSRGAAYVQPLRVPRRGVWVTPVFTQEQMEAGVDPMPAADVLGPSWHWPSVALALLFTGGLAALGLRQWRRARETRRERSIAWSPARSRRHALDELDGLLAEKLPAEGRTRELYTRSSWIVRRFVGRIDPRLGCDLTSSELMSRLAGRTNGQRGTALFREMGTAEVVKFGRARPGPADAEAHVRALRAWVEGSGDTL